MEKRGFVVAIVLILGFVLFVPSLDDAISGKFGMKTSGFGGGKGLGFTPQSIGPVQGFGSGGGPPTDGLILWTKFDDNLDDSSGSGNNYNIYWDPSTGTYVDGQYGKAIWHDSTSNSPNVLIDDHPALKGMADLTIAFWAKKNNNNPLYGRVVNKQNSYRYSVDRDEVTVFIWNPGGSYQSLDVSVPSIENTAWHHYAVTTEGDYIKVYVDGNLTGVPETFTDSVGGSTHDVAIGKNQWGNGETFDGAIDEFIIYNRALSESEIEKVMSSSSGGMEPAPKPCKLESAEWEKIEVIEGEIVGLYVYAEPGTNCNGKSVSLDVLGTGNDPLDAVFVGDTAVGSWDTEDGTWVFEAILNINPGIKIQSDNVLFVPDCGDGHVTYPEECDLTNLTGKNCSDFPPYDNGTLGCYDPGTSNACTFDLSECTMQGAPTEYIIADHNAVRDFDHIPAYWLDKARDLVVHWGHTSHGSQYYSGMNFSIDHVDAIKYNALIQEDNNDNRIPDELPPPQTPNALRIWNEPTWPAHFWSTPYELERTRTILGTGIFNASGWSWCGQVGSCSETGGNTGLNCTDDQYIYDYLSIFNNFSKDFPNTKIIFLTGHRAQGVTSGPNERRRNDII